MPYLFLFFSLFATLLPATPLWIEPALRLTGEPDEIREQALRQLRAMPDLETQLRGELRGENRFLALDVIAALSLHGLLPDLWKAAESDREGGTYLTINSLLTQANRNQVSEYYRRRLCAEPHPSLAVQVILLDTLGRLGVSLPENVLLRFLSQGPPEVRSAALSYARAISRGGSAVDERAAIETALGQSPYQLRLQALFFFSELPRPRRQALGTVLLRCENDPHTEVKALCQKLKKALP